MPPAIRVENLSKRYRIGVRGGRAHDTFADLVAGSASGLWRKLRRRPQATPTRAGSDGTFWALRDVSFEVQPGEVVGIIGRNGAGKSTLLKVLSRITEPTAGRVELRGRVASLLEVGTGFHPDLTGRENVYLNGSLMGMSRREVARKFDEIAAFSETEAFLDTPVKRYSSGMYVRLAFAVAAHLEPEILIVDEVLAVGDFAFQKKCLGKMEDVAREGRTVLFVSHALPSVLRLCGRAMLYDAGRLRADGAPHRVADIYTNAGRVSPAERLWDDPATAPGDGVARLRAVRLRDDRGEVAEVIDIRKPCTVEVEYWNLQARLKPVVSFHLVNNDDVILFCSNDFNDRTWMNARREPGLVRSSCTIPGNFLAEGRFRVKAAVCTYNPGVLHAIDEDAVSFRVVDGSEGDGVRGPNGGEWPGVVRPMLDWEVKVLEGGLLPACPG